MIQCRISPMTVRDLPCDRFALAESRHLVLNLPMGSRLRGSLKAGSRTARQMVLSFVFLLLWGLIAQSTAMIGFGLAGTAVAWILVKRSALREVSTKVEEKELSMR